MLRWVTAIGLALCAAGLVAGLRGHDVWAFTLVLVGGVVAVFVPLAFGIYSVFWGDDEDDEDEEDEED